MFMKIPLKPLICMCRYCWCFDQYKSIVSSARQFQCVKKKKGISHDVIKIVKRLEVLGIMPIKSNFYFYYIMSLIFWIKFCYLF